MAFHEVRFPADISLGVQGGPERRTEVVTLASGREERNALWANSRRSYDAGYGVKSPNDLHEVIQFFEARNGRLNGFRFKDWSDFKSCPPQNSPTAFDQAIGVGSGSKATFQLVKEYASGGYIWTRTIEKPVAGSVLISVNGTVKTVGTHYAIDHATGLITFTAGNIPAAGHALLAGYEFDVPVRFDTDKLSVELSHQGAGSIPSIPIVEIRP